MFTGLVDHVGSLAHIEPRGHGLSMSIRARWPVAELTVGESIACHGVCLTAETLRPDGGGSVFTVTCGRETLDCTTLGRLAVGAPLHLERALRVGDRLGGHFVSGHVDGVGEITDVIDAEESRILWFVIPAELRLLVSVKGSITVDGVSLTVNELRDDRIRVNLIPHTLAVTAMGQLVVGSPVNIEVDPIARHVQRLLYSR